MHPPSYGHAIFSQTVTIAVFDMNTTFFLIAIYSFLLRTLTALVAIHDSISATGDDVTNYSALSAHYSIITRILLSDQHRTEVSRQLLSEMSRVMMGDRHRRSTDGWFLMCSLSSAEMFMDSATLVDKEKLLHIIFRDEERAIQDIVVSHTTQE